MNLLSELVFEKIENFGDFGDPARHSGMWSCGFLAALFGRRRDNAEEQYGHRQQAYVCFVSLTFSPFSYPIGDRDVQSCTLYTNNPDDFLGRGQSNKSSTESSAQELFTKTPPIISARICQGDSLSSDVCFR